MRFSGRMRPRSDVRFRVVGDEGVVLLQDAGEVLAINGVGARIFEHLQAGLDVDSIVDRLSKEFDVERKVLAEDTDGFLSELFDGGVIERVSDGA